MEDGMDFSPHRKSTEHNRSSFEHDEFSIQSKTTKPSAHSQIPSAKKPKLKNKPDLTIDKSSPAGATNPNHASNATASPAPPQSSEMAGTTTAATMATGSGTTPSANNAEAVSNGSPDSSGSTRSNSLESSRSSSAPTSAAHVKRHTGGDSRWQAIQLATARDAALNLGHFRLLKRLGYGDIGSVYLVGLRGTSAFFAMKVMDKASLVSRDKVARAETEREILALLNHPFLPSLYSHFETDKFYCPVMEYCSGGNLHSLRQKQPGKHFT